MGVKGEERKEELGSLCSKKTPGLRIKQTWGTRVLVLTLTKLPWVDHIISIGG